MSIAEDLLQGGVPAQRAVGVEDLLRQPLA